jgi:hypothetical protein
MLVSVVRHRWFHNRLLMTNPMNAVKKPVAVAFESDDQADHTIRELQNDGFDMKKLSIVR